MRGPLLPLPICEIGQQRVSLYPSIANAGPNEWLLRAATSTDVRLVNARTKRELCIPRQYIGAMSEADHPVLAVGLTKELEWSNGFVSPRVKRVIEMPRALVEKNDCAQCKLATRRAPAPVVGIRLDTRADSKASRIALYAGAVAIVVSLLVLVVFRDWLFTAHVVHPAPRSVVRTDAGAR
jgi:hypothetical protein